MSDPYYVLNRNEGTDTLHRNPRESCNVDDIEGRATLDPTTGAALEASGDIRLCSYCYPKEDPAA